jgi:predicted nucleic acid-binding protein
MSGRHFLDTNVFVYSLDRTNARKARIALQIIEEHVAGGNGAVSYQVVQEFFNVAIKRFPKAMTSADWPSYLLTVFRPLLAVHSSIALYSEAFSIHTRFKISWYDSLILAAASEANCSILYTEDLQHGGKIAGVRIENPFRAV